MKSYSIYWISVYKNGEKIWQNEYGIPGTIPNENPDWMVGVYDEVHYIQNDVNYGMDYWEAEDKREELEKLGIYHSVSKSWWNDERKYSVVGHKTVIRKI